MAKKRGNGSTNGHGATSSIEERVGNLEENYSLLVTRGNEITGRDLPKLYNLLGAIEARIMSKLDKIDLEQGYMKQDIHKALYGGGDS